MLARKALAGTAGAPKVYVEDVFSTYLYSGNSGTQTITNGIDLLGKGGLFWAKQRNSTGFHWLIDTERGASDIIKTNTTDAEANVGLSDSFLSDGYTFAATNSIYNASGSTYVSWTFRKAKKFFDVVTYTGNGSNPRNISHNLGSTPGCIVVKRTDTTGNWNVYHRSAAAGGFTAEQCYMYLNSTNAVSDNSTFWSDTAPTSTQFTVGSSSNANGGTYVAYLFAHDAGGFGDAGSDNVITCGSYTTDGSGKATINLGYEPQWLLVKGSSFASNWFIVDTMRGLDATSLIKPLYANSNVAEDTDNTIGITSTGFTATTGSSLTFIYIAIRRGPMKTPTSGTSVYEAGYAVGTDPTAKVTTTNFPVDLVINRGANQSGGNHGWLSRLTGPKNYLLSQSTNAEATLTGSFAFDSNTTFTSPTAEFNNTLYNYIRYGFRRAPGFFDVVCWTGTGSNIDVTHNLGVTPEFIIGKSRSDGFGWICYHKDIGSTGGYPNYMVLNSTQSSGSGASTIWRGVSSTTFSYGTNATLNSSGSTYVAYLFASVSGVSKVGSYTGNGSSVTVTTGFQPRFIMVKRTDSTGNWIVGDSARGLVSADEPALFLNSTAAETTGQDWVDVSSTGFTVNETALNANVNTATYIYLCVA